MKKIKFVLCATLFCTQLFAQKGLPYIVNGKIESDSALHLIAELSYRENGNIITDTAQVINNQYQFDGLTNEGYLEATLRLIDLDKKVTDFTGTQVYETWRHVRFLLDPNHVTITHSKSGGLGSEQISGSKAHDEHIYLMRETREKNKPANEVYPDFIRNHADSWHNFQLTYELATQWEISDEAIDSIYDCFAAELKAAPSYPFLGELIAKSKALKIGKQAPDFSQPDTANTSVGLTQFRGKHVLIDFWASWCGPCRLENPNLVKAYESYREKGFEILGVSLDDENGKAAWLSAIAEDKLVWPQVADLKGWRNEVAVLYNISSIPANFLIDPNGVIIEKNLRGEDLENALDALFN